MTIAVKIRNGMGLSMCLTISYIKLVSPAVLYTHKFETERDYLGFEKRLQQ